MKPLVLVLLTLGAVVRVAAETHTFIPQAFYNTYSFAHPPALRIKPGDRVITKTADASGVDWNGKTVASGPNPQTGPFYVEGAEPGDMLVITIEKLETNRTMAYASSLLAPYAVDPAAIGQRTDRDAKRTTWTIDKAKGVARLDQTEIQPGGIELPLKPMLGCVGVAPARKEAISTATPGAFGGNMDYASMGAGVKLMLPVSEPGALLFLGDGHARQGEGEVVGTGLETSMDVEFTVSLIRGKRYNTPRVESDSHIMAVGLGGSIEDALRSATAGLGIWLEQDYGLTPSETAQVLGTSIQLNISEVADRNAGVVAKLSKKSLATIAPAKPKP